MKVQSIMTAVRGAGTPRDPSRTELAVAINNAAEARKALDNAAAARGRSIRFCDEAEDRLAAAKSGVEAAREALARATMVAATEGTRLAPDSEMRNTRAEEQDADDSVSAARAALAAVESALEAPMDALKVADRRVGELSRLILARAIEPTISDIRRQRDALFGSLSTLHFLKNACIPSWPPSSEESRLRSNLQIPARNGVVFEIDYEANQGASSKWAKYAEELRLSADAEAPSI